MEAPPMHGRLERADGEEKGRSVVQGAARSFAFGERARADLLSYRIYLQAVFSVEK